MKYLITLCLLFCIGCYGSSASDEISGISSTGLGVNSFPVEIKGGSEMEFSLPEGYKFIDYDYNSSMYQGTTHIFTVYNNDAYYVLHYHRTGVSNWCRLNKVIKIND